MLHALLIGSGLLVITSILKILRSEGVENENVKNKPPSFKKLTTRLDK